MVRGYLPEADFENRINAGNIVYGIRTEDGQFSKNADGSYTMVRSARIPIYNITVSEFTILVSVTDSQGNGQNLSGTYSYDAYCESVLEKYSEHAIIPFLKAVKAYSLSAGDYRFGGRKYFPEGVESVIGSEIKITRTSDNTVAKTVYPGETLTYTITVKNNASKAATWLLRI